MRTSSSRRSLRPQLKPRALCRPEGVRTGGPAGRRRSILFGSSMSACGEWRHLRPGISRIVNAVSMRLSAEESPR